MSVKKIITILGVFIIFASLGIGAFFVYQKGLLDFGPDPATQPKKVKITNISHDRFTVSWVTDQSTPGAIVFGETAKVDQTQLDDNDQLTGQSKARKLHHVTISNLKPATAYYFKIRSGEKNTLYDNQGEPYSVNTAQTLGTQPPTDMINGMVTLANGKPAEGTIVYVTIPGVIPLSTQVKKDGSWLISLSNARNSTLTEYAKYDSTTLIDVYVQGDTVFSKVTTNTANKSPVPQITLGETYDFTKDSLASSPTPSGTDQFPLEPDEESTNSGRTPETYLQDPEQQISSPSDSVILLNPAREDEELYTTSPEFLGTGPASKVLTIRIPSITPPIETTQTVDDDGNWSFSPLTELTEGNHTIEIDYVNTYGENESITRDFIITSATGGLEDTLPAIESTPSATIKPTPKPTLLPTPAPKIATNSSRASMPSTQSGVPEPGVNLPTSALLLLGLGLIISGYSWKKYNIEY